MAKRKPTLCLPLHAKLTGDMTMPYRLDDFFFGDIQVWDTMHRVLSRAPGDARLCPTAPIKLCYCRAHTTVHRRAVSTACSREPWRKREASSDG